jgi:hypothetical protein
VKDRPLQRTGAFTGPMSFGEIAHLLLKRT